MALLETAIYRLWKTRRTVVAAAAACLALVGAGEVAAQSADAPLCSGEILLGDERPRRLSAPAPDSIRAAAAEIVDSLRSAGYYYAQVDSTYRRDGGMVVSVSKGPIVRLARLDLVGVGETAGRRILQLMDTRRGSILDRDVLEKDFGRVLAAYQREGRALASISVEQLTPQQRTNDIGLVVRVHEGPHVLLKRIELSGADRTAPSFVARLAGLQTGRPLQDYDPELVRNLLEEAGFFEEVGMPELVVEGDSAAVIRIPINEGDPGTFDLVLGYLPSPTPARRGSIVGNGHLMLRNLFGHGRMLSLKLNRMPRQVSSIEVRVSDPYLLGLPIGAEAGFHGLEQDSTYGKQSYHGELIYRLAGGMGITAGFDHETAAPGQAGLRLAPSGRQVVPHAAAWFLGIGMRMRRLDRAANPTRGMAVAVNLETGRKERSERRAVEADTTRFKTLQRQKRLEAGLRFYVPTFERQVLVAGGDGALLLSIEYDRSDLFRIGGASTLRGYDEDRFLGRAVGRALVEYRFLIDRLSYAYAFFDLGYVDRPRTPDLEPESSFYPGYGIGTQFETAVGLVNVSAAVNPEEGPTEARIHAGLSFGL